MSQKTEVEALVCDDTRAHFRRGTVPRDLDPKGKNLVIDIEYCGLCHTDIHSAKAEWPGETFYPQCPGHEISGKVSKVGSEVSKFKVGDNVGVGFYVSSCGECDNCMNNLEQHCSKGMLATCNGKQSDGTPTYGGFSQKITVHENYVLSIPDGIDIKDAGPLLCAGITVYSPLSIYGAKEGGKGFKTGIVGLGGLGDMAVKVAKAMGNDVTAIDRSTKKKDFITNTLKVPLIVSEDDDDMSKHAGEFDLLLSTIPSSYDPTKYFPLLKTGGKFCIVGNPPEPFTLPASALLFQRIQMCGSLVGGIKETQEMLDFCAEHKIWSEAEHVKAEEVNRAFVELANGKGKKSRFIIDIKESFNSRGEWKVDDSCLKDAPKHKVNENQTIHGAENTAGKVYNPKDDKFESEDGKAKGVWNSIKKVL